jgi:Heat induced stress protein YflT
VRRKAMYIKNTTVFGIYPAPTSVEHGMDTLRIAGFSNSDISVLYPENPESRELAQEKSTQVQHGATVGGGTGVLIGGTMGLLVGMVALAIPGVGQFMAAGPILAALVGAGVGGVVGEIAGALIGMGMTEDEAKRYEGSVKSGGILLSVHSDTPERTNRARNILEETGAQDISSTGEATSNTTSDFREVA